jgi:tRNA(fMet)-specific endonuclease VapC
MKRYILDSGIASDCINHRRGIFERIREARRRGITVGIATPVLGELLGGVLSSISHERNLARLRHALSMWVLWPFDYGAAEAYEEIFAELRCRGRPIGQIDMQIAAIALALGSCTVITSDRDLSVAPGLNVENWAAD